MPDGTNSQESKSFLVHQLERIERLMNEGDTQEAFSILRVAQTRAELLEERCRPKSTSPMDVVNDVGCYIDQALGIADPLTSVQSEDLCNGTIARVGYAIEGILERARERLGDAREVRHD
jgi:hypothetical protein